MISKSTKLAISFIMLIAFIGLGLSACSKSMTSALGNTQVVSNLKDTESLVSKEKWEEAEKKLESTASDAQSLKWKSMGDKDEFNNYVKAAKSAIELKQKTASQAALGKLVQIVSSKTE